MPIPESQLETWSHQGSITQSSNTYNSVKNVLGHTSTSFASKNYSIFLQGSYGNDTNIYAESDVDVVIKLQSTFQHDLSNLSGDQQAAFKSAHSDATYTHKDFNADVLKALTSNYGADVKAGKKAITIESNGNRRKTDVIAAIQYRRYHAFKSLNDQSYTEGICFYTISGEKIINYPQQHSENLIGKQKATKNFKSMVRILKNLRSRLIEEGLLQAGAAPSYYLEGLLYNVPDVQFVGNYHESFVNAINWIHDADRSQFVCANEQYYLLREDSLVTWRAHQCDEFVAAAIELWQQW
jgi:hypothetical protein